MRYRYLIVDVFTEQRFGGNPLGVFLDARGLSDLQMQQIARELNYSESTFVLPPEQGETRRVRIFTPTREIPFAGHPNVGTAFALAAAGELGDLAAPLTVTFEEGAGLVPVRIERRDGGTIVCELRAPKRLSRGLAFTAQELAAAVSLDAEEVVTANHPPQVISVGLPFIAAELRDRAALERSRASMPGIDALAARGVMPDIHLYIKSGDEFDLRTRMYAPLDGVPEDPATGSANVSLIGLLAHLDKRADLTLSKTIGQGFDMGRPSILEASAEKKAGRVTATYVGGRCVPMLSGEIDLSG